MGAILPELETYKYLGVQLDLRNQPLHSFRQLLEIAATDLYHLINQVASPIIEIDYIRFKIISIVLYTAVCSNWTLAQYRKLDVPFSQNYRKILCLTKKSPQRSFTCLNPWLVLDCPKSPILLRFESGNGFNGARPSTAIQEPALKLY
jgi:hypothetical protein